MKLVLVESPGKVKNISQYLGAGYKVLATYGHVRSLPSKSGSVRPDDDFALTWMVLAKAEKAVSAIVKALEKADTLILATDLDREGEAISWHILEHLKEHNLLRNDLVVQRVSFNAITKSAVLNALKNPRELDINLVEAYLARLSLDYLVGFTLSPVLWRKLPGSRSAGRVQSVALRLSVERDQEIKTFTIQEYWSIHGLFHEETPFQAQLTHYDGKKLDKLSISSQEQAELYVEKILTHTYVVSDIISKRTQRHPAAPFITSSLQQEASRKLGYSPSRTMQIAQKLYEGVEIDGQTVGLITYMRTDSPVITPDVLTEVRTFIEGTWGKDYVAASTRTYKVKANSQEAHEAIRPTVLSLPPEKVRNILPDDLWSIYKLIWDRTIASQMASAQYDQTVIIITSCDASISFRASGSILVFEGFLTLYDESKDDEDKDDASKLLPKIDKDRVLGLIEVKKDQHFTQPPARYSEASLIKTMEDLGIGRPSTYARILQVLQEREYVGIDKKRLYPKELGSVVTAFLCKFFSQYVDYSFTASMENQLDEVSQGKRAWKTILHQFWPEFLKTITESQSLKVSEVLHMIEGEVLPKESSPCPRCGKGTLALKLGKTGPFLACSHYPECTYSTTLNQQAEDGGNDTSSVGKHPETGEDILLKKGPYGWYVQHESTRTSLSAPFKPESLTMEQALWLLSLPKNLGKHPATGSDVVQGIGKFGPYIKYDNRFFSIKSKRPEVISMEEAVDIIEKAPPPKPKVKK